MIQFHDRDRLDDAGNYYCALGWAYARGKGKDIHTYEKEEKIFASCAGAAIYRKKIFDELGYFDEEHFAYLEDMDVGYRARIYGYENWYAPDAWYTMWEAVPADPDIISLRSGILPEIIFI